jgi:hypothetical protein
MRTDRRVRACLAVLFLIALPVAGCGRFPGVKRRRPPATAAEPPPPGGSRPVTAERLTGARLTFIRTPPKIQWDFDKERFVLRVEGEPTPKGLLKYLLGPGKTASRVEGHWRLSRDGSKLVLSDLTGDGRPGKERVRLHIAPAGRARVNLAKRQYDIRERH